MKGHWNPDDVFLTPDTELGRGRSRKVTENYVSRLLPTFKTKVLGMGSEVVRFLFSTLVPAEYRECCDVFDALDETVRMPISDPTFSTMCVLGINSFTGRHKDKNDVALGFAGLVALGDYTGE
jgi:hypothetical protein